VARIARVRETARGLGRPVAVLLDTRGAEIRTGPVPEPGVALREGADFALDARPREGSAEGVSVSHVGLPGDVAPGHRVLVDEGHIALRVEAVEGPVVRCRVERGGTLTARRSVHLADAEPSLEVLDETAREDLALAAAEGVDYVAASFVRDAEDVARLRAFLAGRGASIPLIAKIERRDAVRELDAIVAAADGTMVARGDLGVALPVEEVPLAQKRIIRATVMAGKAVITATQMLDSMERQDQPTRAEASDVANAIFDGTSAVMLSGETARGRHPVEAVRTMVRIARRAESALREFGDLQRIVPEPAHEVTDAVAQAATQLANHLSAAALLTLTESGGTSRAISKYRPRCPILAVTTTEEVSRRLALNWGVTPLPVPDARDDEARIAAGLAEAKALGCARPGDAVVVTAGISREVGSTNLVRVVTVP
jgi:pyruvate kinase